jgi:hypothetical protein
MTRPRGLDALLLVLVAACLLFGGGIGCEPELDGTDLRSALFDDEYYVAFYGKKPPGNGWAVLPYPIVPPAALEARVGVVNPRYFEASVDALGCVGLQRLSPLLDYRICLRYVLDSVPGVEISSSLSGEIDFCPMVTGALLRLEDDGEDVTATYTCPGGSPVVLETAESQWAVGQKWNHVFGGYNLGKGAEVGFGRLRYESNGPFEDTDDGDIAYFTFQAFRFGIDAFHQLDDDNFGGAVTFLNSETNALINATTLTDNLGAFPGTDVLKDLRKADSTNFKLVTKLFPDKFDKYFKTFPKVAEGEACAMEGMAPFF